MTSTERLAIGGILHLRLMCSQVQRGPGILIIHQNSSIFVVEIMIDAIH
jgi:hypothetical protein